MREANPARGAITPMALVVVTGGAVFAIAVDWLISFIL